MLGYKGENIAIAYACAYPLGVVGIITSAVILRKMFRINLKEEDRHWDEEASANSDAPIFFHDPPEDSPREPAARAEPSIGRYQTAGS